MRCAVSEQSQEAWGCYFHMLKYCRCCFRIILFARMFVCFREYECIVTVSKVSISDKCILCLLQSLQGTITFLLIIVINVMQLFEPTKLSSANRLLLLCSCVHVMEFELSFVIEP